MTTDRGHIDDMPGFLLLHIWQRRGNAIEHSLEIDVNGSVPVINLEALQGRVRHESGVVEHHVNASIGLDGSIDQAFHLIGVCHIGLEGKSLAATTGEFCGQCLETLNTPSSQYDRCTLCGKQPGGCFAQTTARASDNNDFSHDIRALVQ